MGNVGSYFSSQSPFEQSIGQIDEARDDVGSHQTPVARCNRKSSPTNPIFDPRSPTVDINRTPIIVVDAVEDENSEGIEDPRSPSIGIIRTPVAPMLPVEAKADEPNEVVQKLREDLAQALNFTDLDHLSISNIEEIPEEPPMIRPSESINIYEDTIDFSPLVIRASSTPAPSPVKPAKKRAATNAMSVDENSFTSKSNNAVHLGRPRVPFGDVNRPAMASPRLQLQNKQKNIVRAEIQHQRYIIKND